MMNLANFFKLQKKSSHNHTLSSQRTLFESKKLDELFVGSGLKVIIDHTIKGECRDRYWSSPVLRTTLKDKFCEAIVPIRNTTELKKYVTFSLFYICYFGNYSGPYESLIKMIFPSLAEALALVQEVKLYLYKVQNHDRNYIELNRNINIFNEERKKALLKT